MIGASIVYFEEKFSFLAQAYNLLVILNLRDEKEAGCEDDAPYLMQGMHFCPK